jgi:hypothetical protein
MCLREILESQRPIAAYKEDLRNRMQALQKQISTTEGILTLLLVPLPGGLVLPLIIEQHRTIESIEKVISTLTSDTRLMDLLLFHVPELKKDISDIWGSVDFVREKEFKQGASGLSAESMFQTLNDWEGTSSDLIEAVKGVFKSSTTVLNTLVVKAPQSMLDLHKMLTDAMEA